MTESREVPSAYGLVRNAAAWIGHATFLYAMLLVPIWAWLIDGHVNHTLPHWVPTRDLFIYYPAGLCLLAGAMATLLGLVCLRGWAVVEGLWASFVGLVGVVFVAFMYVMN